MAGRKSSSGGKKGAARNTAKQPSKKATAKGLPKGKGAPVAKPGRTHVAE